jgi:iron complex transport system substrate-binding protein
MRRRSLIALFSLALVAAVTVLITTGCKTGTVAPPAPVSERTAPSAPAATVPSGAFPLTITDARGKTITLKAAPTHLVSLMPSLTEIVYALELGDILVADTTACDYPPQAKQKTRVDVLKGDREKIEVSSPDLVLAIDKLDPATLIDALEKDGIPVLVVKAENLQQTYDAIKLIGRATGKESTAAQLAQDMQTRIETVQKTVGAAPNKPTVLVMYSDNPVYTTDPNSYISDVIRAAGGANIVTEPLPNGVISPEKVVERQPDVIICSRSLDDRVKQLPGWNVVPAVAGNRFFHESDKTTLVRPGPRLAVAVEELARFLHPDLFKP